MFHLRPEGFSSTSTAQIVSEGNSFIWLDSSILTFVPMGYSKYLMKHSVVFQPTNMMHEMFTMRENPIDQIGG